jgi:hypothetical protein
VGGASVVGAGAGFEVAPPPAAGCELPPELVVPPPELAAVDPAAPGDGVACPEPVEEDDGTLAPLLADVPDAAADFPADDCVPADVVAT